MEEEEVKKMEGVASIALMPSGSVSGHFVHLPHSICYGLRGTEVDCERECSRGEDYRLIKLCIMDYAKNKEKTVVVECRGHDAARFTHVDHAHGWGEIVGQMVEQGKQGKIVKVFFQCETLLADEAAECHIGRFMPKLTGLNAIINIGHMCITGLDFDSDEVDEMVKVQDH